MKRHFFLLVFTTFQPRDNRKKHTARENDATAVKKREMNFVPRNPFLNRPRDHMLVL